MTTAYVVQVDLPRGTKYLGRNAKLYDVPRFFKSISTVRDYISGSRTYGTRDTLYNSAAHCDLTKVITIRELDKGLKESRAVIQRHGEFLNLTVPKSRHTFETSKNSVFKLQLADGSLVKLGTPKPKFGKIWSRAGDLRSHLTKELEYRKDVFATKYKGAQVVEIVMHNDGINIKEVRKYGALDFYVASPACRKNVFNEGGVLVSS